MLVHTLMTARDLGRLQEIAGVLMRHGLGELVRRLGWVDTLARAGHELPEHGPRSLARLTPPEQLRHALEELGPTFVKAGQILAGRADLLGPEWIAQLERLHSQVPALPYAALRAQLEEDLGGDPATLFARFETEAFAAASIAQVHRATLHDGSAVVVKVRRPGIEPVIEADLRLMERLAHLAAREWPELAPYRPVELVRQFGDSLRRELDLAQECRQAERIAANFAQRPDVHVPKVYWDWTHPRVNVQEDVGGISGHDLDGVDAAGLDRRLLARRGAQAVLQMIVQDGLFHADPHPGNVFYLAGNRIAFIDFGMVGRLTPHRREELLRLLLGLVQRDPATVAEVLMDWTGDDGEVADEDRLGADIEAFVDQYHGVPLAQLSLGRMLADVTGILRRHRLVLPADLALLIKAFISLEGMGRGLDPEFHMAQEALPMLEDALRAHWRPRAVLQRGWAGLRRLIGAAGSLPQDLVSVLRRLKRQGVQVHVEVRDLRPVVDQLDRALDRLTVGVVVAALVIGSSIVMTVGGGPTLWGLPAFGLLGFLGAVAGGAWLMRRIAQAGRRRPPGDGA